MSLTKSFSNGYSTWNSPNIRIDSEFLLWFFICGTFGLAVFAILERSQFSIITFFFLRNVSWSISLRFSLSASVWSINTKFSKRRWRSISIWFSFFANVWSISLRFGVSSWCRPLNRSVVGARLCRCHCLVRVFSFSDGAPNVVGQPLVQLQWCNYMMIDDKIKRIILIIHNKIYWRNTPAISTDVLQHTASFAGVFLLIYLQTKMKNKQNKVTHSNTY